MRSRVKWFNNEIQPFSYEMLWPNGTKIQMFTTATAFMDCFTFQMNTFPIYLPLKPRTSKNMVRATFISAMIAGMAYRARSLPIGSVPNDIVLFCVLDT